MRAPRRGARARGIEGAARRGVAQERDEEERKGEEEAESWHRGLPAELFGDEIGRMRERRRVDGRTAGATSTCGEPRHTNSTQREREGGAGRRRDSGRQRVCGFAATREKKTTTAEMGDVSTEEKMKIASSYLVNSPPGEFIDVFNGPDP